MLLLIFFLCSLEAIVSFSFLLIFFSHAFFTFFCVISLHRHATSGGSGGRGGDLPCPILKIEKKSPDFFGKNVLFVCIYELNSHLKCSFKSILKKRHQKFPGGALFCISHMKRLSKCPYSKEPSLPRKIPGCAPTQFLT